MISKIKSHYLTVRKAGDKPASALLSTFIGEAEMVGKNKRNGAPTDDEVILLLRKFINNNSEVLALTTDQEKIAALKTENDLLATFLPQQMSVDEIKAAILASGAANKGDFMKYMKSTYAGKYDAKMAISVYESNQ